MLMPFLSLATINKFWKTEPKSVNDKILDAITDADVNTVLSKVKADNPNISKYLQLSNSSFGVSPKVSISTKLLGISKIALASALLYKTGDYFKTEYSRFNSFAMFIKQYKSIHNILMDTATLSQLVFSYMALNSGINNINPRSCYKKQLLIKLYLENLLKK